MSNTAYLDEPENFDGSETKKIENGRLVVVNSAGEKFEYTKEDLQAIRTIMQHKLERLNERSSEITNAMLQLNGDLAELEQ
jgi:hypothetical protein